MSRRSWFSWECRQEGWVKLAGETSGQSCAFLSREAHGIGKADAGGSIGKENQAGITDGCKTI